MFFNATVAVAAATGLVSCGNDWLDQSPYNAVPAETAVQSSDDLESVRTSMYAAFKGTSKLFDYYGQLIWQYGDVRGEDIQYNYANGSNRAEFYYYMNYSSASDFYCSTSKSTAVWQSPFIVIGRANRIIEADNLSDQSTEANTIAQYKAEAKVMRSFALFDLTRIYGKPFTQDDGASLGAPIVETSLSSTALPARSTVAECYKKVIDDLTEVISSGALSTDSSPYFINVWAAKALLLRVYLTKADWQNALSTAEDIIENSPYKLWTIDEYATAWNEKQAAHLNEMLFEIQINNTTDSPDKNGIANLYQESIDSKVASAAGRITGYGDLVMTKAFLDMLEGDPQDVRNQLCLPSLAKADSTAYGDRKVFLKKFQGSNGSSVLYDDVPVLRLSEVYLSAAEAAFNANDKKKAAQYLNNIIENRTSDETKQVAEATVTLDRIYTERRKELVGEGQRFFDALRRGETITRYTSENDKGWHGVLNSDAQVITPQSKKLLPLIPQDELNANPNIEQNPLY